MNTIKTIFVTVTLLAVGYGTHKVLNSPGDDRLSQEGIWSQHGGIEIPGVSNEPSLDLPPLHQSPGTSSANPFVPNGNDTSSSRADNPFKPNALPDSPPPYAAPSPNDSAPPITRMEPVPGDAVSRYGNPDRPDLGIGALKSPSTALPEIPAPAPLQPANPPVAVTNASQPNESSPAPSISSDPYAMAGLPPNVSTPPTPSVGQSPPIGPLTIPPPSFDSNGVNGATMNFQQPIVETPAAAATPTQESIAAFSSAWQNAQNFIGQGKLADALGALSSIYNQPMNDAQRGQLVSLLDQLAGTVIYSQQHLLHPAYTPRPGETTAQVAMRQRVPADFLARVNGVNPHQPLSPDMRLKVVTGPFRGELSRSRRELTLFLGNQYAGRFSVSLGNDFPAQSTSFEVFEKSGARAYNDPRTGQQIPAGNPANPYGAHWIGLRVDGATSTTCGMHSAGAGLDASDSRGCIGLASNDADDLKAILELGSGITVVR